MLKKVVWEKAKVITSFFEGWLSGNFDGQFLSYGYLQWNIGQGTLQPMFKRLFNEFPQVSDAILPDGSLRVALEAGTESKWALAIQRDNRVVDPWLSAFKNLFWTPEWQQIMDDAAVWYQDRAIKMCEEFNLKTDRAFALAFDIAVQNGGLNHYEMAETEYIDRLTSWAEVAAMKANPRWQNDVRARKMAIVNGKDIGRGWCGAVFDDQDAFGEEVIPLDWKSIIEKVADDPESWECGIKAAVKAAEADGSMGDLEIFKYLPQLIEKIYNPKG